MTATMIEGARRQSGRAAARTDYVYVVTFHYGESTANIGAVRTAKSARKRVTEHNGRKCTFGKIGRNNWISRQSGDILGRETFYSFERIPLHA